MSLSATSAESSVASPGERVLVTGASGFLGSHIVDALLARGFRVRAMVRARSSRRWLAGKAVEVAVADVADPPHVREALASVQAVVHAAGVSSGLASDYDRVNVDGTAHLLSALKAAGGAVRRVVYISSLAAGGPAGARPRRESDHPRPVSPYGRSKLAAERLVLSSAGRWSVSVIRPPALFGPRDRAFLPFVLAAAAGWALYTVPEQLTCLAYGPHVAAQVVEQLEAPAAAGQVLHVAGAAVVRVRDWIWAWEAALARPVRQVAVPAGWARLVLRAADAIAQAWGGVGPFPANRLEELLAASWAADDAQARSILRAPAPPALPQAVAETLAAYRADGWLGPGARYSAGQA